MRKKHILIVDDEEKLVKMIDFLLVKKGYHVTTALNGREAFMKAQLATDKGDDIDLLITDIDMPEMDGFDLMSEIHNAGLNPKALAISGKFKDEGNYDFAGRGFNSFLQKPFGPMELVEEIKEVFRGKELRPRSDKK